MGVVRRGHGRVDVHVRGSHGNSVWRTAARRRCCHQMRRVSVHVRRTFAHVGRVTVYVRRERSPVNLRLVNSQFHRSRQYEARALRKIALIVTGLRSMLVELSYVTKLFIADATRPDGLGESLQRDVFGFDDRQIVSKIPLALISSLMLDEKILEQGTGVVDIIVGSSVQW